MTATQRIVLNIVVTYGRSLVALVCGLFTSRWVLMSLGVVDFGLYSIVGGLTVFITFFNGLMAGATARFYAFSIGFAQKIPGSEEGLEECRKWFNTAFMVHLILSVALVCIGYPIGTYVIRHGLTIPIERMDSCIWVFRYVAISCFVAMFNVPFAGMFRAKQYIAELTLYSFIETGFRFAFVYYMVTHPGKWLAGYAAATCVIGIIPQLLICARAIKIFPECQVNFLYWWNWGYVRKMLAYTGWHAFGGVGSICRGQGMAILVNKYFGVQVNAAVAVANQVNGQSAMLSTALEGAFAPAITTACGVGNYALMCALAFRACKFGTLLVLVFVIPLSLELQEVMRLWLKNPPSYSTGLCWCMMMTLVVDKLTSGHMLSVNATGRVAAYHTFLGSMLILTLPIAFGLMLSGLGPYSVGYSFLTTITIVSCGRLVFGHRLVEMPIRYWFFKIFIPLAIASLLSALAGAVPRFLMPPSFMRILVVSLFCEVAMFAVVWPFVMECSERLYVTRRVGAVLNRIKDRF